MRENHNLFNSPVTPPPRPSLPVFQKLKSAYLVWFEYYQTLPKAHRHTLGQRVDNVFIEIIEAIAQGSFVSRSEKISYVQLAIRKMDTLKALLMILWETKSLDNKKYIALSLKVDEVGRMLGGWGGQLNKQNSSATGAEEK